MGRGSNETSDAAVVSRSRAASCELAMSDFLAAEHDANCAGELVTFGNEGQLVLQENDPVLAIKGLAEVAGLSYKQSTGHYHVTFRDGSKAVVDLDTPPGVALENGSDDPVLLRGALYAAQARAAQMAPSTSPDSILHLADTAHYLQDSPDNPEALRLLAQAAVAANGHEETLRVNDPALAAELGPKKPSLPQYISERAAARERMRKLAEHLHKVAQGPTPEMVPQAILYAADANGAVEVPMLEEKLESARRLGGEHLIPESGIEFERRDTGEVDENGEPIYESVSVGEYHFGPDEEEFFSLVRNRVVNGGQRFLILRGDPSTGKNEAVRQMAAMLQMPLVQLNLGPRFDLNDAMGGEGLGPSNVYEEVPKRDPETNEVIKDDDGNIVMEKKLVTSVAASKQVVGTLARAAQEKCIICIDEPEGIEDDLVQLNAAFGSDIGDPGKRFLSINSMSGKHNVEVDPDCIFVVTFNPGDQELRLRTSTHNRALNYDFEYPRAEEEAKQLAVKVTKLMNFQQEAPGLQREYTPEDVMPIVTLVRRLRDAHKTSPDSFIDFPDGRQASYMFADLLLEAYRQNDDAIRAMQHSLRFLLPGSRNMPVAERDKKLREQMQDVFPELNELVQLANKAREDDLGGGTQKKASKGKGKAKSGKKAKAKAGK